jgi:hypothetical protein
MTDLIKRLEALEAPCRECDCLIGVALGWFITEPNKGWPDQLDYIDVRNECWYYPGGGFDQLVPRFTASLDAAMMLVPQGDFDQDWSRSTRYKSEGFKLWQVRIALETVEQDPQELGPVALGEHDTPAIALCIAALRIAALRAQEVSHDGR